MCAAKNNSLEPIYSSELIGRLHELGGLLRRLTNLLEQRKGSLFRDTLTENHVGKLERIFQVKPSVLKAKPDYTYAEDWDSKGNELFLATCKCTFLNGKTVETEGTSIKKQNAKQRAAQEMLKEISIFKNEIGWKDDEDEEDD